MQGWVGVVLANGSITELKVIGVARLRILWQMRAMNKGQWCCKAENSVGK